MKFSGKQLTQAKKELEAQVKTSSSIVNKLTDAQRAYLNENFGTWKRKTFKLNLSNGSLTELEQKFSALLQDIQDYAVREKLTDVRFYMSYSNSMNVQGCIAANDAELAIKFQKFFQRREKEKLAKKNRVKARAKADKQAQLLSKAATIKEVAKLLKQLNAANSVSKQAAKSKPRSKKAKKVMPVKASPFETR